MLIFNINKCDNEDVRDKISKTLKEHFSNPENHWAYGKTMSDEHNEKLRQSKLNNPKNVGNKKPRTDEQKEKLRQLNTNKKSKRYKILQYSLDNILIKEWNSLREIERIDNTLKRNQISKCCKNLKSSYGGYIWKYKNSYIDLKELNEKQRRDFYIKKNYPDLYNKIIYFKNNVLNIENFSQLLYHYYYDITEHIKCYSCDNNVNFRSFNVGYNKYCSKKCSSNDIDYSIRNEKSKNTCIEKYGVDNPLKSKEIIDKARKTSLDRYGKEHFTQTDEYIQNIKEHNLSLYGKEWYLQTDEFKNKSQKTSLSKYGVTHPMKNINVQNNFRNSLSKNDKYIFKQKMNEYFGSDKFLKVIKKNREKTDIRILEYYQNYNDKYKLILIEDDILKFSSEICNHIFTINKQLFYLRNRNNHECCTICNSTTSNNTSQSEKQLLEYIKSIYSGLLIPNYRDKYEIDIYLPELKIGFEYNGLWFHSTKFKDENYHINKSDHFKEIGIEIVNIWENDWRCKNEIIKSIIKSKLGLVDEFNDDYLIKEIGEEEARIFLDENSINGYKESKTYLSLYGDEIITVISITDNTIIDFTDKLNMKIIGSFNKLINYYISNYKVRYLTSYVSKDISNKLFIENGFKHISDIKPDYIKYKEYTVYNCGYSKYSKSFNI